MRYYFTVALIVGLVLAAGCTEVPLVQKNEITIIDKNQTSIIESDDPYIVEAYTLLEKLKQLAQPGEIITKKGETFNVSLRNYDIQYSGTGVLPVIFHNNKEEIGKYVIVNYDLEGKNKKPVSIFKMDLSRPTYLNSVLQIPFQFSGQIVSIRAVLLEDGKEIGDVKLRNELRQGNGNATYRLDQKPTGNLRVSFQVIDNDF